MSTINTLNASTEVLNAQRKHRYKFASGNKLDLRREVQKRWMMVGVLVAVTLAVLAPRLGAPGGRLQAEYTTWLPLCYVFYSAGRRAHARTLCASVRAQARVHLLCCAHAHLVSPALAAAVVTALTDGVDYRIIKGVMLWSCGGGCAWLSLALSARGAAPAASALVYAVSLLATPLHTALLCGRAALPSAAGVVCTLCTTAAPFLVGVLRSAPPPAAPAGPPRGVRLAALVLLYAECCERLCDAEAILYATDVMVAFALEVCCVLASAAWCWAYARAGVLEPADARLLAAVALPRALDTRWTMSCAEPGMCRLPGVFVMPAQALLLTALAPHCDGGDACADDLPR